VGSHGTNLTFNFDANQVTIDRLPQSLDLGDAARPFPQYQGLGSNSYNAISNYNALQVQVRRRFAHGLSVDAHYTWSKFLDEQDSAGWGSRGGTQNWQYGYVPGSNYGFSNFDHPHMVKADVVYELPFGRGRSYLTNSAALDALLGGWQAAGIFVAQSGSPFNAVMSGNNGSNSKAGNWFPNLIGDPGVSDPSINRWFNQAAFAAPAPNNFGTNGRNDLRGPRLVDLDFSLGKNFKIPKWERAGLQFRFDATNFLNHPSFSNPNASIDPANSSNPALGRITSVTMGGRQLQLGVRFSF
jgi:hypothetical protein